jgi:hypothetical protein
VCYHCVYWHETALIPNALLVFTSCLKCVDYRKKIISNNHEKWLETDLIPSPPPNSILMIHNAIYHNSHVTHIPTFSSWKMWWTTGFQIMAFFSVTMCECKQYSVTKMSKTRFEKFIISTLIAERSDSVVCLLCHDITHILIWLIWYGCLSKNMLLERMSSFFRCCNEIVWGKD